MRRRRKAAPDEPVPEPEVEQQPAAPGPHDFAEVQVDEGSYADLGSLLISPPEGMDLQLQVDEASGQVLAVLLANEDGAVELRAFAAARHADLWSDARREIAAEWHRDRAGRPVRPGAGGRRPGHHAGR